MKTLKILSVFFFGVCISLNSSAQNVISVVQEEVSMSKGSHKAYVIEIPQADYDASLKNWKKAIRQNTKNKIEESDHEIIMEGTQIDLIYNAPINIYSALIKKDSSIKMVALFEIDSVFFDFENSEKSIREEKINSQIKHFLINFGTEQYLFAVEKELENEENKLKAYNKEMGSLEKEKENLLKSSAENEQNIKNSEDAITGYEADNERKMTEINAKKESISNLENDPALADQAKDQLKSLEKEKKDIENNLEKEQKKIVEYNSTIESLNKEIESNTERQAAQKETVDKQTQVVEGVRKKLNEIR